MIRTLSTIVRQAARTVAFTVRDHVAQYIVCDDCGTFKPCYTLAEAREWLAYCGEHACIRAKISRDLIEGRAYSRAY